jgi:predicted flavoprotein YhiN
MNPRRGVRTWLGERLPERIADIVTAESGIGGAAMSQVPRERRAAVLRRLLARDVGVTGTLGYEKAEVTAGGVALAEVNASTLESRVAPGLWLCGEVLDVEGRLGGFNFQWSWSSGTVAGRAAAKK